MVIAQSKLTVQGQVSIPAEVRRRLGLSPGALLEWDAEGDKIVVRRVGQYTSEEVHRALFPEPPAPKTVEQMKEGVRKRMRERHARR